MGGKQEERETGGVGHGRRRKPEGREMGGDGNRRGGKREGRETGEEGYWRGRKLVGRETGGEGNQRGGKPEGRENGEAALRRLRATKINSLYLNQKVF